MSDSEYETDQDQNQNQEKQQISVNSEKAKLAIDWFNNLDQPTKTRLIVNQYELHMSIRDKKTKDIADSINQKWASQFEEIRQGSEKEVHGLNREIEKLKMEKDVLSRTTGFDMLKEHLAKTMGDLEKSHEKQLLKLENKISGPMTLTSIKSATGWDCTASSFALSKALLKLKNNDKATFKLFNKASGIPALKGKYKINGNKLNVRTKTKKFFLSGFMRKFVSKVKANKNKMTIKLTYSLFAEGKAPVCKFNYTGKFKK